MDHAFARTKASHAVFFANARQLFSVPLQPVTGQRFQSRCQSQAWIRPCTMRLYRTQFMVRHIQSARTKRSSKIYVLSADSKLPCLYGDAALLRHSKSIKELFLCRLKCQDYCYRKHRRRVGTLSISHLYVEGTTCSRKFVRVARSFTLGSDLIINRPLV